MAVSLTRLSKIIAGINLLIVLMIVLDNYLLPLTSLTEIVIDKKIEETKSYRGRGYTTYYLISQSGKNYNVSSYSFNRLNIDDSFFVSKTYLFKKAIALEYYYAEFIYTDYIGVINKNFFGKVVLGIISIIAILLLLIPRILKSQRASLRLSIVISWISIVIIFFYFYYQA